MKHFTCRALGAFLLFFMMMLWHSDARAQLAAGDLAVVGFYADNPDEFTLLVLKDLPIGQTIFFTDNGWSTTTNDFRPGEGTFSWTNNTGNSIPCGSTIEFVGTSANIGSTTNLSGSLAFSGSGDQILVYTGSTATPTFITAINFDGTSAWGNATSSTTSALPPGLVDGSTAVGILEIDNAVYDCSTVSGTPADIRTAVFSVSNWTKNNTRTGISDINPCTWNVTCPVPCTAEAGTLSAPSSACALATLSASASGFENDGDYTQTYVLADASGNILDIQSTGQFSSIQGGSYLVASFNYLTSDGAPTTSDNINSYSKGTDCFDIESASFNVGDPQPSFNSPPSQVCENGIATFTLSSSYSSYAWPTPANASITSGGSSSDNFAEVTFGSTNTSVSVTVTDAYGCTASTSQVVLIGTTPTLAQQGCNNCGFIRLRICQNDPTPDLNAYITSGNSAYVNGYSLNWCQDSDGEPGAPISPPSINTANPGMYTYYVAQESPDGCEGEKIEVRVRVRATPNVSMSMPTPLCEGAQVNLALYVSDAANKADLYEFYLGDPNNGGTSLGSVTATNGVVDALQSAVVTLPPGTHDIYVVATNNFNNPPNCDATTSQSITVKPEPVLDPIAAVGPICPGDPIQVSFSSAPTASVFVWSNSNTAIGLASNGSGDINGTAGANISGAPISGQVTVFGILGNCTSNPVTFDITIDSDPVLASGLTDMVCSRSGANIDLAGNSVTNMPGETYKWAAPTFSAPMTGTGSEVVIGFESFDGGGVGYSAPGQFNGTSSNDYFNIRNNTGGPNYIGKDGTNYWAAEDVNGPGSDLSPEKTLTLNAINISGAVNPRFEGLFAAARNNKYDALDYIYVEYNVDNSGWSQGLRFSYVDNGDPFNEPLALDTDNDGDGDGQVLTINFAPFGFNIPNGNSVQIRVRLRMDGGDEEVAFDNLQVFGTVPGGGARMTASAAPITDGYENTTGSPQTVTYMVVPVSAAGCEGDPVPVVVTVKPEPVVASASASVCSGEAVSIALSEANSMTGVSYSWPAPTLPSGVYVLGPHVGGNGSTIAGYSFVNTLPVSQDVIFEVSGTNTPGCQGGPTQIVVSVASASEGGVGFLAACEDAPGTGTATFDLSSLAPVYEKNGSSWDLIANPAAYVSGSGSVFLLGPYGANCAADWAQMDLLINDAPLSPSVDDIDVCEGGDTKITPGAPGPQAFTAFWDFDNASSAGITNQGAAIPQNASFGPGIGVTGNGYASDYDGGTAISGNNWNSSSLNPDDYLEFCVSPSGSFDLELTRIDFESRRSGSGPMEIEIHYSTDGFATAGTLISGTDITITGSASVMVPQSFSFAPITHDGPICIRIYGYDASSSLGTWRFDDVALSGNLIPQLGSQAADFMWTFEGNVNTGTSSSANGTAANAAFGGGNGSVTYFSGNGGGRGYSANSWSTGALATNEFIEFCVSANPGWEMELTDLEFDEKRSNSGIRDFDVYYSFDNFATAGTLVGSENVPDNDNWRGQEFELTISGATQVCFRIYGYNAEGSGGNWRFDNVVISGSLTQMAMPAASAFNFYDGNPNNGGQLLAGGVPCYDPQTAPGSSQTVWVSAEENGCESPAVPVNVNVKPAPFIQATNNGPVCEGSAIILSAAGQAIQYNWSGPNFSFQGANATITSATPANGGQYQLIGIDGDGCSDTVYTQVQVDPAPYAGTGVHLTVSTTDPIFNLFGVLLNSPQTGGVWAAPNGTPLPSGSLGTFNPAVQQSGYYTYTVGGAGACAAIHYDSARVLVTVLAPSSPPSIAASVMLQGAYDSASGLMTDGLRSMGVLPLSEPFTALGYTHTGGGAEYTSQQVLNVTGMDAIVDWIVIELRDAQDPKQVIATRSALLQRDGDIVDVDGISPVSFNMANPGNYHVAIFHRNHLKVMTSGTFGLGSTPTTVDLSSTNTAVQGTNPMLTVNNVRLMFAGDADGNGQIQNSDDVAVWKANVGTSGYNGGDYNLDGQIQNSDRMHLWVPNAGKGTQVPE